MRVEGSLKVDFEQHAETGDLLAVVRFETNDGVVVVGWGPMPVGVGQTLIVETVWTSTANTTVSVLRPAAQDTPIRARAPAFLIS